MNTSNPSPNQDTSTRNGGPDDKITQFAFYFFMSMVVLGLLILITLPFV